MTLKNTSDFTYHILVIDDDNRIRSLLDRYLTSEGYLVSTAKSAIEAEALIKSIKFSIIITDKMMPEKDGFDFVKDLRESGNQIPVIMLTAMGDVDNKINGLLTGADDYIAKPFEPKELHLRILNILKRIPDNQKDVIKFSDYSFYISSQMLKKNNVIVSLTTEQKSIMNLFMKNINKVISRSEFLEALDISEERSIDVAITRLRKKLEGGDFILTVRNQGYKFVK